MRSIIFYNPAVLVPAKKGADHATLDDIRATAKALSASAGHACVLRDATVFSGDLERQGDEFPAAVYLLGPDCDAFDAIRQAFEEVEVSVEETDFLEEEAPSKDAPPSEGDVMADLKARATALGINFSKNIGEATLRARVESEEAKRAEEAGGSDDNGDDNDDDNGDDNDDDNGDDNGEGGEGAEGNE